MAKTGQSSDTKKALLEKYLRYNRSLSTQAGSTITHKADRTGAFPLTAGQQSIYFLSQLTPDVPMYNECVTLHLGGSLNIPVFERSFNEILRRHEEWRTCFPVENGEPVQRIQPFQPLKLSLIDLTHLPEEKREAEALRIAAQDSDRPFDFAHGPLLRPLLIQLSTTDTRRSPSCS